MFSPNKKKSYDFFLFKIYQQKNKLYLLEGEMPLKLNRTDDNRCVVFDKTPREDTGKTPTGIFSSTPRR